MDPFSITVGAITLAATLRSTVKFIHKARKLPQETESLLQNIEDIEVVLQHADAHFQRARQHAEPSRQHEATEQRLILMIQKASKTLSNMQVLLNPLRDGKDVSSTPQISQTEPETSLLVETGNPRVSIAQGSQSSILNPGPNNGVNGSNKGSHVKFRWMKRSNFSILTKLKDCQSELINIKSNVMLILSVANSAQSESLEDMIARHSDAAADSFAAQHLMQYGMLEILTRQHSMMGEVQTHLQAISQDLAGRPQGRRTSDSNGGPIVTEVDSDEDETDNQRVLVSATVDPPTLQERLPLLPDAGDTWSAVTSRTRTIERRVSVAVSDTNETSEDYIEPRRTFKAKQRARSAAYQQYCAWGCNCTCHKSHSFATAQKLSPIIGNLALEVIYPASITGPCNQHSCRRRSAPMTQFEYKFPRWLIMAMVSATFSLENLYSCNFTIRAARIVPDTALIFRYATEGNLEGIRRLFAEGKASAFDADESNGTQALVYATDRGHVDVWRFLLEAGADPYFTCKAKHSTMDVACSKLYTFRDGSDITNEAFVAALKKDFDTEEYLEQRHFPSLHKLVLGIHDLDLESQLRLSTSEINERDYQGRTAVSWAAMRGDFVALEILLRYGADPNLTAFNGDAPLHYAVRATTHRCIEPLLRYGADVNATNAWRVNPLCLSAANRDNLDYVVPLLNYNANLELMDKHGRTALVRAINLNRPNIVKCLLQHGAVLPECDLWGSQPLVAAIEKRFTEVANIILEWSTLSFNKSNVQSVLEVARRFEDTEVERALLALQARFFD